MAKVAKRSQVADDSEVPEVAQQLTPKCCPLLANRCMPVMAAPFRDAPECPPKAVCCSLLLYHPISLAGHGPVVGEAQQVEGVGPGARIAVVVERGRNPPVRPSKFNQPGLLRVKCQAVLRQPLRQYVEHSPCVPLVLEDDDSIVGIANESRTTGKPRHNLPCKPLIKHLVQVDVCEDWGNYSLNAKDNFIFERAL